MRVRTYLKFVGLVLVVGGLAAAALWPDRVDVEVVTVARGPMEVTIDEEGETRVRERFVVSAPVSGRLLRIDLEPGDRVTGGRTVVARLVPAAPPLLDPRTRAEAAAAIEAAQAAVQQAQAERERTASSLEHARRTLDREEMLAADGAVSRADLDRAHAAFKNAEAGSHAAEAAVRRAEREMTLAQTRLRTPSSLGRPVEVVAPVDGQILTRRRQSEGVVAAGEALVEIGDPSQVEVIVDLLSADAVRVAPGHKVRVEGWGGSHPLSGRVRRVEPSGFMKVSALGVEERRVNVVVAVDRTAEAIRLGDGYRVEARIVVWSGDAVTVPSGALFRLDHAWAVFVVEGGRARVVSVEVGERNNDAAQILSGLAPGQSVVLHPADTLRDGVGVNVVSANSR
jgi:HlyD family secretion protein